VCRTLEISEETYTKKNLLLVRLKPKQSNPRINNSPDQIIAEKRKNISMQKKLQ